MKKRTFKEVVLSIVCLLVVFQVNAQDGFDPTVNIAQGSPAFASTGSPQAAVDGNNGTRWESAHGNEEEWWYVDLGNVYDLRSIEILWEGAYGKSFDLLAVKEMPESGQEDADWEAIFSVRDKVLAGFPREELYNVNGKIGRYIKFQGVERGTAYGYSFFEFRVYANGLHVEADDRVLETVVVIPNPAIVCQEEEVELTLTAFCNYGGAFSEVEFSFEVSNSEGIEVIRREEAIYVKGLAEGIYDLKVIGTSTDGNNTEAESTIKVEVLEKRRVEEITLTSSVEATLVGRQVELSLVVKDQYGEIIEPEQPVEWNVEGVGEVVENVYISMGIGEAVIAAAIGEVESEPIHIYCVGYDYNIALHKEVEAIGEVENSPATLVNDGNEGTRWAYNPGGDAREYEAWITIDLGEVYEINMIEILWEGATAADYGLYYSLDNEDFGEVRYTETDVPGLDGNKLHQFYDNPGQARYVKMLSTRAATQYGVSIWEFRIYGSKDLEATGEEGHLILSGVWDEEAFAEIDNETITSYDMSQVMGLLTRPVTQNPNCLIFVENGSFISGEENVVTGNRAERIVLEDGAIYNNSVREFEAGFVSYARDFTDMNGWASLYLPFPVTMAGQKVEQFVAYAEGESSMRFAEVTTLAANTPYIIQVDATTEVLEFISGGVILPLSSQTNYTTPEGSDFTFKGTFTPMSGENKLILKADGSEFAVGSELATIAPFRAYVEANDENTPLKSLGVVHDETTGIDNNGTSSELRVLSGSNRLEIISPSGQILNVYSMDGRLVSRLTLEAGYNVIDGLSKGIYIVQNQKVVIK